VVDNTKIEICSRCIYDERTPAINFDEEGVCNYCHMVDDLLARYKTGSDEGVKEFGEIVEQIKKDGKGKKYDCVIGVSGGTDSSYMVIKAIEYGLRPLAVHYDNTWNTAIAAQNIRKLLDKLNVNLYTHVTDNKEADDIFKSFFKAEVPEMDASTDLALAEVLYRAANKVGVKYILEGHSFVTEGVSPLGTYYFDGKYIKSIHKKFGKLPMKTYPLMDFKSFMKWVGVKKIKKIRPLWYLPYDKGSARQMLQDEYGWEYYGGHHLENRMSAFTHSYWLPKKFNNDQRNNAFSAEARMGIRSREECIKEYGEEPYIEAELLNYVKKRLKITDKEFDDVIFHGNNKNFRDYPTYKKRFERLRPLFYSLAKANLVPMSFYIKYTSKSEL